MIHRIHYFSYHWWTEPSNKEKMLFHDDTSIRFEYSSWLNPRGVPDPPAKEIIARGRCTGNSYIFVSKRIER